MDLDFEDPQQESSTTNDGYWSRERTERALMQLAEFSSVIRANSHPLIFEQLSVDILSQVEEWDQAQSTGPNGEITDPHWRQSILHSNIRNEAFRDEADPTSTVTTTHPHTVPVPVPNIPSSLQLEPTMPSAMSIYISVVRGGPQATSFTFDSTSQKSRKIPIEMRGKIVPAWKHNGKDSITEPRIEPTPIVPQKIYHWPQAPVREQDMAAFFHGIEEKLGDDLLKREDIFGYVFYYVWNDEFRFCMSDTHKSSSSSISTNNTNTNADTETDSSLTIGNKGNKSAYRLQLEADLNESWHHRRHFWTWLIGDLHDAAKLGTRVWRLRVAVVTA